MARDYDSQLLESVSVRRRRLRDALLFGSQRVRRTADERLGKVFIGIAIVAVLCAGCVGWSFLQHTLEQRKAEQEEQQRRFGTRSAAEPGTATGPEPGKLLVAAAGGAPVGSGRALSSLVVRSM